MATGLKGVRGDADIESVAVTDTGLTPPIVDAPVARAVDDLCRPGVITAVVQPIVRPADMVVVGYEALARMPATPPNPPDWWLDRASELGLRPRLEAACLGAAARLGPPPGGRILFVNASPSTVSDPGLLELREALPERLV